MEKYCSNYVGLSCIDGTCPVANAEEYEERGIPLTKSCRYCFYYEGCKDCMLVGTEYCTELKEIGVKTPGE